MTCIFIFLSLSVSSLPGVGENWDSLESLEESLPWEGSTLLEGGCWVVWGTGPSSLWLS